MRGSLLGPVGKSCAGYDINLRVGLWSTVGPWARPPRRALRFRPVGKFLDFGPNKWRLLVLSDLILDFGISGPGGRTSRSTYLAIKVISFLTNICVADFSMPSAYWNLQAIARDAGFARFVRRIGTSTT